MVSRKSLLIVSTVLLSQVAFAAPKTYTYLRTIDFGTTASGIFRPTVATSDARGWIYAANNRSDAIAYFDPLTVESHADPNFKTVYDTETPSDPFGPHSFSGITVDPSGDVFASGVNGPGGAPDATVLYRATPDNAANPTSWDQSFLHMPAGAFGGCTAVGDNQLVMPVWGTGALQFFTVSGNSVTAAAGAPVAGPGEANAPSATADIVNNRIFITTTQDNQTGKVYKYTSNGTKAGTSYSATNNPVQTSEASSYTMFDEVGVAALRYRSVAVNSASGILCASRNRGTAAPEGNQFELYDLSSNSTTPYQIINGADTPEGLYVDNVAYGATFFSQGGINYLFVSVNNTFNSGHAHIYKEGPTASVNDWTLY